MSFISLLFHLSTFSFIYQGTLTRRQRSDLFGLLVKLLPAEPLKVRGFLLSTVLCPRTQQANLLACSPHYSFNAKRQAGKLWMVQFYKYFG